MMSNNNAMGEERRGSKLQSGASLREYTGKREQVTSLYRQAGEVSRGLVRPLLRKGEGILRITAYWNGVRWLEPGNGVRGPAGEGTVGKLAENPRGVIEAPQRHPPVRVIP